MSKIELGIEGFTAEDAAFTGSRFAAVRDALSANPYPKLPRYEVSVGSLLRGLLPGGPPLAFLAAARRVVDSHADLRWGPDRKGYRRLVHPNGVCLTGIWEITADTPYTGYFQRGSRGLVVGRYSTCCTETRRGYSRSLALVGRVYPTTDPAHPDPLPTANFITQEDLGGAHSASINEAVLRNAPDTSAWRRGAGITQFLITGAVFILADKQPAFRQVYQLAELGKPAGEPTRAPEFMQLTVDPAQPVVPGDDLDFRDEVLAQIYDPGDPQPKRRLTFRIAVSDEGSTKGPPVFQRRTIHNWKEIGTLTFDHAVASYNGDFVVHFNHPVWRTDRNDPATAKRKDGKRV